MSISILSLALSGCSKPVAGTYLYKNGAETTTIELKADGTCSSVTEAPLGKFGAKGTYEVKGNGVVIEWTTKTLLRRSEAQKTIRSSWSIEPNAIVGSQTGHRYLKHATSAGGAPDSKSTSTRPPQLGTREAQLLIDDWASWALRFEPKQLEGKLGKGESYKVTPGLTVRVTSVFEPQMLGDHDIIESVKIMFHDVPIKRMVLGSREQQAARATGFGEFDIVMIYSGPGDATFRYSGERWFLDSLAAGHFSRFSKPEVVAEWYGGVLDEQVALQERQLVTPYPPR